MLVTARAEYACLAMLELAERYGEMKLIRLVEITEKHGIPQRFLVQILLQMKTAGLVQTTRGSSGGYRLARTPDQITLADILSAMSRYDEPEDREISESPLYASLQKVWKGLSESNHHYLLKFRLSDLITPSLENNYVI